MTSSLVTGIRLPGGVAFLLGNGFFLTAEFAMTRVRQSDEAEFRGNGRGPKRKPTTVSSLVGPNCAARWASRSTSWGSRRNAGPR